MKRLMPLCFASLVLAGCGKQGPTHKGKPVSYWVGQLDSHESATVLAAIDSLKAIGASAVPALIGALEDESGLVLKLIRALDLSDPIVRSRVIWALQEIGPGAREAVPVLIEYLENEDDSGPDSGIVWALAGIGAHAFPALIDALKHPSENVRRGTCLALSLIGPKAATAVPALIRALEERGTVGTFN